jgi:hypothetical protein
LSGSWLLQWVRSPASTVRLRARVRDALSPFSCAGCAGLDRSSGSSEVAGISFDALSSPQSLSRILILCTVSARYGEVMINAGARSWRRWERRFRIGRSQRRRQCVMISDRASALARVDSVEIDQVCAPIRCAGMNLTEMGHVALSRLHDGEASCGGCTQHRQTGERASTMSSMSSRACCQHVAHWPSVTHRIDESPCGEWRVRVRARVRLRWRGSRDER